jgi:hypothetical protein
MVQDNNATPAVYNPRIDVVLTNGNQMTNEGTLHYRRVVALVKPYYSCFPNSYSNQTDKELNKGNLRNIIINTTKAASSATNFYMSTAGTLKIIDEIQSMHTKLRTYMNRPVDWKEIRKATNTGSELRKVCDEAIKDKNAVKKIRSNLTQLQSLFNELQVSYL